MSLRRSRQNTILNSHPFDQNVLKGLVMLYVKELI